VFVTAWSQRGVSGVVAAKGLCVYDADLKAKLDSTLVWCAIMCAVYCVGIVTSGDFVRCCLCKQPDTLSTIHNAHNALYIFSNYEI
jgi:hypothetical protein